MRKNLFKGDISDSLLQNSTAHIKKKIEEGKALAPKHPSSPPPSINESKAKDDTLIDFACKISDLCTSFDDEIEYRHRK